ncbi:hypothetical protein SAMN05446934_6552 [Paraburkholderia hospita]|nr:hypothetical protein PMI06_003188 [Burkholderia sp. BT03]SKC60767.1 hypothetical protein SAMN06266956_1144 [Paraburkholderia hospita]SKC93377.1 hypothetical protein SAMN05446934_6552 [Paraburkholderia hospita]
MYINDGEQRAKAPQERKPPMPMGVRPLLTLIRKETLLTFT